MSEQDADPRLERAASSESIISSSPFLPVIHEDVEETLNLSPLFPPIIPNDENLFSQDPGEATETHGSGTATPTSQSLSRSFVISHYQSEESISIDLKAANDIHDSGRASPSARFSSRSFVISHYEDDDNDVPPEFLEQHVEDSLHEAINTPLRSPTISEPETVLAIDHRAASPGHTEPFPELDPSDDQGFPDDYVAQDNLYSFALGKVAEHMNTQHEATDTRYAIRGSLLTVDQELLVIVEVAPKDAEDAHPCLEVSHYDHFCADHEASKLTLRQQVFDFLFLRTDVPKTFRKRFSEICNNVFDIENIIFRAKKWPKDPIPLMTTEELRAVFHMAVEMVEYLSTLGGLIYHEKCEAENARVLVAEVARSNLPALEMFKHMAEIVIEPQRFFEPIRLTEQSFFDLFFLFYDVFLYDDFHVMYNNYLVENMPNVSTRLQQTSYLLNTVYNIMVQIVRDYEDVCLINKDIGKSYVRPVLHQLSQQTPVIEEDDPFHAIENEEQFMAQSGSEFQNQVDEAAQALALTDLTDNPNTAPEDFPVVNHGGLGHIETQTNRPCGFVPGQINDPASDLHHVGNPREAGASTDGNTEVCPVAERGPHAVRDLVEDSYLPAEIEQEVYFPSSSSHIMSVDGPSFDGPSFESHRNISQHDYDSGSDGGDTEVMSSGEFSRAWARCKEAERQRLAAEQAAANDDDDDDEIIDLNKCIEEVCGSMDPSFERSQTLDHGLSYASSTTSRTLDFEHNDVEKSHSVSGSHSAEGTQDTRVDSIQANITENHSATVRGPIYSTRTAFEKAEVQVVSPSVATKHKREQAIGAEFDILDVKDDEDWIPHDWEHDHDRPRQPGFLRHGSNPRAENEPGYVSVKTFAARLEEMAEERMYEHISRSLTSTDAQYNTPCFAARRASTASEQYRTGFPMYEPIVENRNRNYNSNTHVGRDGADSPLLPPFPEYGRRISDLERERRLARERDRARRLASMSRPHLTPLSRFQPPAATDDQGSTPVHTNRDDPIFPPLNLTNPMHAAIAARLHGEELVEYDYDIAPEIEPEIELEFEHEREAERERQRYREQHPERPRSSFFGFSFGRSRASNRPPPTSTEHDLEELPLAFARTSPNGSKMAWWRR